MKNMTFSLRKKRSKLFPETIECCGVKYGINADFRNVLKILAILRDPEILDIQKPKLLLSLFFKGTPPINGVDMFCDFLGGGEEGDDNKETQYDFEFDSEEIYSSFFMQYGIDLVEEKYLHWYKFLILLKGLSADTPFQKKIELRFADLKGLKGKELTKAAQAKERVQLPVNYTAKELAEIRKFEEEWGKVNG